MRSETPEQFHAVRRRPWRALLAALMRLADDKAALLRHGERPWASVTFSGTRHTIALAFPGAEAVGAGEAFVTALPEHEFAVPGQVVVEAAVTAVDHEVVPEPRMTVEIELLLLEEA